MNNIDPQVYNLLHKFIEHNNDHDFNGVNGNDPLVSEIEQMLAANHQFFYVGDIIKLQVSYVSQNCDELMGIPSDELTLYHFFEATHPDDLERLSCGRAKLIKIAQDLFIAGSGSTLLSTNFRMRNPRGGYSNILIQCYLYFTSVPHKTVHILKVHTNIDWYKQIKFGYHYYLGNDMSNFRYPDKNLLMTGNVFSEREFEIIQLIASGLNSEQVADKIFISINTVNTHRRNILKKTGKANVSELIYELQERGVL